MSNALVRSIEFLHGDFPALFVGIGITDPVYTLIIVLIRVHSVETVLLEGYGLTGSGLFCGHTLVTFSFGAFFSACARS